MHLRTARQRRPSAHGRVIGNPGGITEPDHPLIIHGQKFQNGNKEFRLLGPGPHGVEIRACRAQKGPHEVVLTGDPAQCLERDGLGCFLLHSLLPSALETVC